MLTTSSPPRPASGGRGAAGARPDSAVISRTPTPTAAGTATFPALALSLGSGADGGTASVQIAAPVGGFEGGSPALTAMLRNQSALEPPLSSLPQSAAAAVVDADGEEEDPNVSDIHSASAVGGGQRKGGGGSGAMDARSLPANASAATAPPPSAVDLLGGLPPPRTQQLSTAAGRTSSIGSLASRPPSGRGALNSNTTRPLPPSRAGSGAPVVSESRRSVLGERNGDFAVTKDKHHTNRTASTASAKGSTSTVVYSGFSPTAAYDSAASRPPSSSAGGSMPPRPSSTAGGMSSNIKKGGGAALPPLMSSSSVVAREEAPQQQRLVVECVDGSTQTDFAPSLLPPPAAASSSSAAADAQSRDDSSATTINGQCVSLPDTARPSAAPSYAAAVIPTLHMQASGGGGGQLSPTAVAKQRAMVVGIRGRGGEGDGSEISEALVSGLAALVGPPSQHQIPAPTAGNYHRRYAVGSRFGALHHRQSAMGIYGPSEASTAAAAAAAGSGPTDAPTLFLSAEEAAAAADSVFAPSAVLQKYWAMQWVQRHSEQFERYYRDILASRAEALSASATPGAVVAPREGRAASPSASPSRKNPAAAASTAAAAAAAQASAQQRKQRAADRLAWMSMGGEGPMSPTKEAETVPSISTVADPTAVPVADPPIGDDEATRRLPLAQEAIVAEDPSRPLAAAIAQIEKRHGCEVSPSSAVVPIPRPRSGRNSPTHTSLTTAAASSRPSSASAPLAFPPSVHVRTSSAGGASDDATVLSAAATPTNASVPPIIAAAASSSDTAKKTAPTAKKPLRGGGSPLAAAARGDNSDSGGRAASASSPQQHGEEQQQQQQQQQSWRAVVRAAEISSQKADIALDEELRQRGRDRQSRQLALAAGGARARLLASSPERRPASGVVSPKTTTESAERRPSFEEALPNIPFRDVASAVGPSQTTFSASDAAKGGTAAKGSGGATGAGPSSSSSVFAVPPPYASPSVAGVSAAEASLISSPPQQQLRNSSSSAAAPRQRTIDVRALAADVFHNDSLLPEDVNFERRVAAAVAARRVGGAAGAGDGDPNGGGVAGRRQQRQAAGGAAVTVRGVREKVQAQINVAKFMQTFPDLHPLPAQSPNSQAPVKGRRQ